MLDLGPSALRTAVSRLQVRIRVDAIATDAAGCWLDVAPDAREFERLLSRRGVGADRLAELDIAGGWWTGSAVDEVSAMDPGQKLRPQDSTRSVAPRRTAPSY